MYVEMGGKDILMEAEKMKVNFRNNSNHIWPDLWFLDIYIYKKKNFLAKHLPRCYSVKMAGK